MEQEKTVVRGRLAPSPSGRMHLGNAFSALLCYLSVKSRGGSLVLRIEDLDRARCRWEYAEKIMDDLMWLGISWDEGPYWQSRRLAEYDRAFAALEGAGLVYPCYCTREARLCRSTEASAPHGVEAAGSCPCKTLTGAERAALDGAGKHPAWRVEVADETISFLDGHMGLWTQKLKSECGDFIIRRSDFLYAYQLAVSVDDGAMGVTEVVRGADLLPSTPRQIWLCRTLGYDPPDYSHVPLLVAPDGRRLSKRDGDLDLGTLRSRYSRETLLGWLGYFAGLLPQASPTALEELLACFSWDKVPRGPITVG